MAPPFPSNAKILTPSARLLGARNPKDPSFGDAIFGANIALGKAALRNGDRRAAARYMLAAAETPGSEALRGGYDADMSLQRALVDWGERDAVAQFLERMAAQIRKGANPDLRPTVSGCGKGTLLTALWGSGPQRAPRPPV